MSFKFNPITAELDLVGSSSSENIVDNFKIEWALESIRAFDKETNINYITQKNKKIISEVVYTSELYPDLFLTKTVSYLDAFTDNQRIDSIIYAGDIFGANTLIKNINYTADFCISGYKYEVLT